MQAASQWAAAQADKPVLGPTFVSFASVADSELVESAILDAMSLGRRLDPRPLRAVISHIGSREGLLVLDNCEHLVDAVARTVASLLVGCPKLRVLATSREPLGAAGETIWQVPPLSTTPPTTPPGGDDSASASSDAARLFLDRAFGEDATGELSADARVVVDRIVRELDGIPLAMELAAAHAWSLPMVAAAGQDRAALVIGETNRRERHRTMRRCLDWSHAMLTRAEAVLFRRLSVFAGGWSLQAAEQVCGDGLLPVAAIREQLLALIDKSLVQVAFEGDEARYRMLWPVWQYAAEKLADAPAERRGVVDRHREWCLGLAERADTELWPLNHANCARLDRELSNIRAALENAGPQDAVDALRLVAALSLYWRTTGRYWEGAQAVARALAAAPTDPHGARARALACHAWLLYWQGDLHAAVRDAEAAVAMADHVGEQRALAQGLSLLGAAHMLMNPTRAQPVLRRAADLADQVGDPVVLGDASSSLCTSFFWQDDYPPAIQCANAAEEVAARVSLHNIQFWNRWMHAHRALAAGDLPTARRRITEGQRLLYASDPVLSNSACEVMSLIDVMGGDAETARASLLAEMRRTRHAETRWGAGFMTVALALAELALGNLASARAHAQTLYVREHDETGYLAWRAQHVLMLAALADGDATAALRHVELIRHVAERLGNRRAETVARAGAAHAALLNGDLRTADVYAHDALVESSRNGWWLDALTALELIAVVAARRGQDERAARLFAGVGAARAERALVRVPAHDAWWSREIAGTPNRLADPQARSATEPAMSLPELAEFALRGRGPRSRPSHGPKSLTPMQLNVARLAARGFSNADIAEKLFIARGTVKTHLAAVFGKLDVHNRTQLAGVDLPDS